MKELWLENIVICMKGSKKKKIEKTNILSNVFSWIMRVFSDALFNDY